MKGWYIPSRPDEPAGESTAWYASFWAFSAGYLNERFGSAWLDGENAGRVADQDHSGWYRELFAPSVAAGILKPADLAGYRNGPVHIRRSKHVPPGREAVRELLPAFFELLQREKEPAVRAVLGHFVFVYIHPCLDGNGRIGRFLMNVMMVAGGYPWTVVPVARRDDYLAALESASVDRDIGPLTRFLGGLIKKR